MLAIQFPANGSPDDVLQAAKCCLPEPQHGELRVRMLCSPVNPSDLLFIRGRYTTTPAFPQIPGFEGVGIVEASGGGLRGRFFRGKRVVVLSQHGGTWGQQVNVPATQVVPVPSGFTDEQAATSFVNPMTAWLATQQVLQIPEDAVLIQTAAGSILGRMIIKLGHHLGFHTINVVRSEAAVSRCEQVNASSVIQWDPSRHSPEQLQEQVQAATGGRPVKFAIDVVSGATGSAVLECLSEKGRFLACGTLCKEPLAIATRQMMSRQLAVESFWLGHRMKAMNLIAKLKVIRKVQHLVHSGVLETPVDAIYPLTDFQAAVTHAESQNSSGRVLLSMKLTENEPDADTVVA